MESLPVGKINLSNRGKSPASWKFAPRQSSGISRQASASFLPAKGPEVMRQFTSVSQASPMGSDRLVFSGYSGASECEPQRRGLKVGSMRNGSVFIDCEEARA